MAGCMSSKALDVLEEHCYATLSSSFHRRSDNSRRFNHSGSIFATSCLSEGNSALQLNMGKSWLKRSTPLNQHERENSKTFKFASNLERSYNSEGKPTHLAETQKKALKLLSTAPPNFEDPPFEVLEVNKDKTNSRTEPACEAINPLLTPTLYSMNRSAPMESIRSGWKTCSNRTNPWLNRSTPLCHDKENSRRFNHSGSIFATSCLSEGNSALQLNMRKSWLKRSTPLNQHERENSKTFKFASNLERSYNSEGKPTHLAETQKKALKLLSTAPPNFEVDESKRRKQPKFSGRLTT
ncbi:uncharacterized protein LOC134207287 [Armigeres subalbatus]|uniref:uncharacterized protein LOC134207287 n=1 Tax=Armigeres subalbatus TaxID=124917 RepID=UPI002ED47656